VSPAQNRFLKSVDAVVQPVLAFKKSRRSRWNLPALGVAYRVVKANDVTAGAESSGTGAIEYNTHDPMILRPDV
jgi:hypothetical protein